MKKPNEEMVLFTSEETEFVIGQFNQLRIYAMTPEAVGICQLVQSIAEKMKKLTEETK